MTIKIRKERISWNTLKHDRHANGPHKTYARLILAEESAKYLKH